MRTLERTFALNCSSGTGSGNPRRNEGCRRGDQRMSIRKMIALHPDVAGPRQPAARRCRASPDVLRADVPELRRRLRGREDGHGAVHPPCLDCSDVCEAAGKLAVRRTGSNEQVLREMLELCARVCDECAAECEKHDHEHCKLCAQMCRECAADCRVAAESIGCRSPTFRSARRPGSWPGGSRTLTIEL